MQSQSMASTQPLSSALNTKKVKIFHFASCNQTMSLSNVFKQYQKFFITIFMHSVYNIKSIVPSINARNLFINFPCIQSTIPKVNSAFKQCQKNLFINCSLQLIYMSSQLCLQTISKCLSTFSCSQSTLSNQWYRLIMQI